MRKIRHIVIATCLGIAALATAPHAQQISADQLKPGFVMNFYPIQDESKPDQPQGRPIASLIYDGGFPFAYYQPFTIEPALKKYQDKWWLLTFEGYLNLTENGDYTFAATLASDRQSDACGSAVSLNGTKVIELPIESFQGNRNDYADIPLAAGLYPIKVEYFCTDRGSPAEALTLEFSMRGPDDAILAPVSAENIYHVAK